MYLTVLFQGVWAQIAGDKMLDKMSGQRSLKLHHVDCPAALFEPDSTDNRSFLARSLASNFDMFLTLKRSVFLSHSSVMASPQSLSQ